MRQYGSIQTSFWTSSTMQPISDKGKLLAIYLLSSAHTNMLGCFRIPVGYIAEDLRWSSKTLLKTFNELIKINFLTRDQLNDWIVIHSFLKNHPIENPNQAKSIEKLFSQIPGKVSFISQLAETLLLSSKYFSEGFCNRLRTLSKPFLNQEQEQNQNQKQERDMSSKKIFHDENNNKPICKSTNKVLKQDAAEVLAFLNEKAGRAFREVNANLKFIVDRLKSGASVDDCRQVIAKKSREWKSNPKMAEYLRPATLFNDEKFEQYLGELVLPINGGKHVKK